MISFNKVLGGLFCLMLMVGCTGYHYVSTPPYIPVNTDSGMLNFNISFSNYQLGYAFKNFSVFTTGYYRNTQHGGGLVWDEGTREYYHTDKHYQFDVGATHFKTLNRHLSYELVAGTGYGGVEYSNTQDLTPNYEFDFDAQKINLYLQPNITFRQDDFFDFSIFSKVSYNQYFDIHSNYVLGEREIVADYDEYFARRKSGSLFFFEPGFQMRLGWKNVKGMLGYRYCAEIGNNNIRYRQTTIHLGVSLCFGNKSRQEQL